LPHGGYAYRFASKIVAGVMEAKLINNNNKCYMEAVVCIVDASRINMNDICWGKTLPRLINKICCWWHGIAPAVFHVELYTLVLG
jgi:hypothetical protein